MLQNRSVQQKCITAIDTEQNQSSDMPNIIQEYVIMEVKRNFPFHWWEEREKRPNDLRKKKSKHF